MSQTIVPAVAPPDGGAVAAPAAVVAGPATLRARLDRVPASIRHSLDRTPGRLRLVSVLAVLAALIVALGGGAALRERHSALDEASRAAAHLVLVQRIQTSLVQADADVTNGFLKPGLEPVAQRQQYIASMRAASNDLALAAAGQTADAQVLGSVNADLSRYAGYVSSARATNRAGQPVGASYLRAANSLLQAPDAADNDAGQRVLPRLRTAADLDRAAIDSAYSRAGWAAWYLVAVVLIGLGGLVAIQAWLARTSRRILNVPLAAASALLLLVLVVAGAAMAIAQSRADSVRSGALDRATRLSTSRVAAFSAKSQEALTLIAQGSATKDDQPWTDDVTKAAAALPAGNATARAALADYQAQHEALNVLDTQGNWEKAVASATSSGGDSANSRFEAYDQATRVALEREAKDTADGLGAAGNTLLPAGILVLLAGLGAAAAAWWGVSLRLDEYR